MKTIKTEEEMEENGEKSEISEKSGNRKEKVMRRGRSKVKRNGGEEESKVRKEKGIIIKR